MKNYVVKIEKINYKDGLIKYVDYLKNDKHSNHKKTNKIVELSQISSTNFMFNTINADNFVNLKRTMARKGGRPSTELAKSLTFNIPKEYNVGDHHLKLLNIKILKDISAYLKVDIEELEKKTYSVAHFQENTHIHFLIATTLVKGGKQQKNRDIKTKSFLNFVKSSFTKHLDDILETNITKYKPLMAPNLNKITKSEATHLENELMALRAKLNELKLKEKDTNNLKYLEAIEKDLNSNKTIKAATKMNKYLSPKLLTTKDMPFP